MCSLRGVRIPAGQHVLVFTCDCSDFDKGRYVSLGAFGVAVVMVVEGRIKNRFLLIHATTNSSWDFFSLHCRML